MAFMFSDTNIRSPFFGSKFKSQDDFYVLISLLQPECTAKYSVPLHF